MWFKNKRNILIIFSVLLFSLSLPGCAKKVANPPPTGTTTNRTTNPDVTMDNNTTNPNGTLANDPTDPKGTMWNDTTNNMTGNNTTTGDNDLYTRGEKIATAVNSVSGVRSSKVIISNNRALVGVDMVSTTEGSMTDEMKSNIEKAVKSTDSQITSVAVTADPDIFTRITNVGNGIRSGRPLSEFGNETEELFRRVVPR